MSTQMYSATFKPICERAIVWYSLLFNCYLSKNIDHFTMVEQFAHLTLMDTLSMQTWAVY